MSFFRVRRPCPISAFSRIIGGASLEHGSAFPSLPSRSTTGMTTPPTSGAASHVDPRPDDRPDLSAALAEQYRIERELGHGGMATVYLAEDVKHHRRVAIKVLHAELSAVLGPERFLKEIELTANLQHSHILPLFDSGSAVGLLYYVMPFVEGETLRTRLERESQLPVGDALRIATEVADALDYAHRRGVVHRDIKPENILIRDGHALVADFGIALAVEHAGGTRITQTGLSLGTPQYMSPEQAMGERTIGPRSDIYSLGAITYEMLLGEPPFTGPTAQAIVAQVITAEPRSLTAQRKSIPPAVGDAVRKALEKLPADRFASPMEFVTALSTESPTHARSAPATGVAGGRRTALAAVAALGMVAGLAIAAAWAAFGPPRRAAPVVMRRSILDPDATDTRGNFVKRVVSPDGSVVVSIDDNDPTARLTLRRLDQLTTTTIAGTESGRSPFISWDSRTLGFVSGELLQTEPIDGGAPTAVPHARTGVIGAPTWTPDGRIVFTNLRGGLSVIRSDGGGLRQLTAPDSGDVHISPSVLPNGKGVLFTISAVTPEARTRATKAAVVPLAGGQTQIVANDAAAPQYDDGQVLFVHGDGSLAAVPFDEETLRTAGAAASLGDRVAMGLGGVAYLSVGRGVLVYQRVTLTRMMLMDRTGVERTLLGQPAQYHRPSVSPNGRTIALDIQSDREGQRDVWLLDIASGTLSRLTNVGDGHDPDWTPDGRRITFLTNRPGAPVFTVPVDRSTPPVPFHFPPTFDFREIDTPGGWLSDGRAYLAGSVDDIWLLEADGSAAVPLANSPAVETAPTASSDGRWFAYVSNESGRQEVYVQALKTSGARTQVSRAGGSSPAWAPGDRALYYLEPNGTRSNLVEVTLDLHGAPTVLGREQLVAGLASDRVDNHANFAVMPDDKHFVVVVPDSGQGTVEVTGWQAALHHR